MLTINTQIPTIHRGTVRALVKAHSAWDAFKAEKGIVSSNAKNHELLEFALRHASLQAQIETVLGMSSWPANIPADILAQATKDENMRDDDDNANPFEGAPLLPVQGFDAASVLANVDQFLSPLVRSEIEKALAPVIDAANKPAVEIERIVEVQGNGTSAAPRVITPKARRGNKTTFRTLFPSSSKEQWNDMPLTIWNGAPSPAVDPHYVINREQLALVMGAIELGENFWAWGHASTGKSTIAIQSAAHLGRPCIRFKMMKQTDVNELIGSQGMGGGNTFWTDGALVQAIRQPGMVIIFDDITLAPASVQDILMGLAENHRSITLPTGEVVRCADGVVIIATDNSNGTGNETGLYEGVHVANGALVTRFPRMLHMDYLSAAHEARALVNHTACPQAAAKHLADFIATCRRNPALEGVLLSLRQMIGFVRTVQQGFSAKLAFETAFTSRMPATERATMAGLADLVWTDTFEALVHSKPLPVQPSNSPASNAFADTQSNF